MDEYDPNKRDTERIDLLGSLGGEVMVFQPMGIRQISLGGMQVETGFPLQLDSLHDFRITLGECKSRLRFCQGKRSEFGRAC